MELHTSIHLKTKIYVNKFDSLLTENKASFDTLFGSNDLAHLAIELYDDLESLNAKHILDEIGGYYNNNNQTIHLVAEDTHWKQVLLHEYTHYRVHQLAKENGLASVETASPMV